MPKNRPKRLFDELRFNVAQLLKEPTGAVRRYDVAVDSIGDFDDQVRIVEPIVGQVDLLRTGEDILVTGTLRTMVRKECGRCLTIFTAPISIELEEQFRPTINILTGVPLPKNPEIDEMNYIDEQHILDLTVIARQELFLEGDSIRYCRPDCKGLCPHCGQDRNVEPCSCQDEIIDPRWADLLPMQTGD